MSERIQKFLSNLGYGSRREIEEWINEGRLVVNGAPAEIGQKIAEADAVKLDGKRISLKGGNEPLKVLIYKKRTGEMVTRDDPEGRRTVFRKLPELETGRWIAVGRLDVNTSGLLLMTNHGELARRLMHPSFEQQREYAVRALGELQDGFMQRLKSGVQLEDGPAHFESIRFGDNEIEDDEGDGEGGGGRANHWFVVTITEGRHREVRRLFESQGLTVNRLIRTAYGPIKLGRGIKSGGYREATKDEIHKLLDAVGLEHHEALPERVRESYRERSDYPRGGKPAPRPKAQPVAVANEGPKPKFRSGAEGWSKASRDERKQVERGERFARERPGIGDPESRAAAAVAKPWSRKPAVASASEPQQFKARGFGAKSERSYAERGDSAPPPRRRESAEGRAYAPRGGEGERPAYAKKPYGDRARPAGDGPAFRPRTSAGEGRPAYAKKPYGDRPVRETGERPAYAKKPYGERPPRAGDGERPAFRSRDGERPAYAKKPYGERSERPSGGEGRPAFKPRAYREDGTRPAAAARKPYGAGAARGDDAARPRKPYGERPARSEDGGRPAFKPRFQRDDAAPARKPYGDRPSRGGEGGERPAFRGSREDRPAKSYGDRPAYRAGPKPAPRPPAKPGQRYAVRDGKAVSGQGKPKLGLGASKKKPAGDDAD